MKNRLLKPYNALLLLVISLLGLSSCEEPEPIVKPMYGVSPACHQKKEIKISEEDLNKKPVNEKDHHQ